MKLGTLVEVTIFSILAMEALVISLVSISCYNLLLVLECWCSVASEC